MISDCWTKLKTLISHNYPSGFNSAHSNIHQFFNRHQGEVIAVLGSGPSLTRYRGGLTSIAVNGAALYDVPYSYFMCGDDLSPTREWFYASERFKATRIIASFVSVEDKILFPNEEIRSDLRRQLRLNKKLLKLTGLTHFLYPFAPKHSPESRHAWFQYESKFSNFDLKTVLRTKKFQHGATISGVALQMAVFMGASEVHIYGCSFDNESGNNYFNGWKFDGKTNDTQKMKFNHLVQSAQNFGVKITIF